MATAKIGASNIVKNKKTLRSDFFSDAGSDMLVSVVLLSMTILFFLI
jgi:hypothetical protein